MSPLWWAPLGLGAATAAAGAVGVRRLERRLLELRLATVAVRRVRATNPELAGYITKR